MVSNRGEHHMKVADFGLSRNIECDMTAYETKPAGDYCVIFNSIAH